MPSFISLGVGSNLPLDTLLTNLTTAEKERLTPITQQQSANTSRLTTYGTLRSALEEFQTANTALSSANLFKNTIATNSAEDSKISTTVDATLGEYTVNVAQLAQTQSLSTTAKITSTKEQLDDTSVDERTIMISQPGRKEPLEVKLGKGETSLKDIRGTINDVNGGASANLVKVKEDGYQLVLTAESDTGNEMAISVSDDSKLGDLLPYGSKTGGGRMRQLVGAQNAQLTVDGIDIERQSNAVTNAPQGITLQPTKEVKDTSIIVTKSNEKVTTVVKAWIEAYNSLVDTFGTLTKCRKVEPSEAASANNGALLGDSVLRATRNGIRAPFASGGNESSFETMSEIGITQDGDAGKLKIDKEKLVKTLRDNTAATRELSVGDDKETGITTRIATEIKNYLTDDGIIDNAQDSTNTNLRLLTRQYPTVGNNIDEVVVHYKAQFTQLDSMTSKLNSTSTYLSQQFAAMSNS